MGETHPSQDTIDAAAQPDLTAQEDLTDADAEHTKFDLGLSRRGLLISGGLLGLLGLGSGGASADATGQIGTTSDPLTQLHTEALNGASLPDFTNATTGQILAFDANNDLTLAANGGDVSELSTSSMEGLQVFEGGSQSGDKNNSTDPINIIGNHSRNKIEGEGNVVFGGNNQNPNEIFDTVHDPNYSGILSGKSNIVEEDESVVCGGNSCKVLGTGNNNNCFIGGGLNNFTFAKFAVVCGGESNKAQGSHASVAGGQNNIADGSHSFAAGKGAKATKDGSFVFGDSSNTDVTASAINCDQRGPLPSLRWVPY
jgi:hypothetical protein